MNNKIDFQYLKNFYDLFESVICHEISKKFELNLESLKFKLFLFVIKI